MHIKFTLRILNHAPWSAQPEKGKPDVDLCHAKSEGEGPLAPCVEGLNRSLARARLADDDEDHSKQCRQGPQPIARKHRSEDGREPDAQERVAYQQGRPKLSRAPAFEDTAEKPRRDAFADKGSAQNPKSRVPERGGIRREGPAEIRGDRIDRWSCKAVCEVGGEDESRYDAAGAHQRHQVKPRRALDLGRLSRLR